MTRPPEEPYRGRIRMLAAEVEAHAGDFRIRHYFGTMQYDIVPEVAWSTTFCLAGAAFWLSGAPRKHGAAVLNVAAEWLGLNKKQASRLFTPPWYEIGRDPVRPFTVERAVAVLRHLSETGDIDWNRFLPDGRRYRWWRAALWDLRQTLGRRRAL